MEQTTFRVIGRNRLLLRLMWMGMATVLAAGWTAHAEPTVVDFRSSGTDPRNTTQSVKCVYKDILKEGDSGPVLEFSEKTIDDPQNHAVCQSILNNYTRLDEVQVRKEIAEIIQGIQCVPGEPIEILASTTIHEASQRYHQTKNANFIWKISLEGCLGATSEGKDIWTPIECTYPHGGSYVSSQISYKNLIYFFTRCRDAINRKVKDEKILEKWRAANPAR